MALFDDPNKELRRLQAELLAEEADFAEEEFPEDDWEEEYDEEPEWEEDASYSEGGFTHNMTEVLMEEEADFQRTVYYKEKRKRGPGYLIFLLILAFLFGGWLAWTR